MDGGRGPLLIKQVKLYGTKWRTICSAFESRPSLTCRNRWRKLVTEVVRGKASIKIKEEVESVTNGNSSSVLETLNRQQEELSKIRLDYDSRVNVKRRKTNTERVPTAPLQYPSIHNKLSTKSETEWLYSVNQGAHDHYCNTQSKPHIGTISNREQVKVLIEYAKPMGLKSRYTNTFTIITHRLLILRMGMNLPRQGAPPAGPTFLNPRSKSPVFNTLIIYLQ